MNSYGLSLWACRRYVSLSSGCAAFFFNLEIELGEMGSGCLLLMKNSIQRTQYKDVHWMEMIFVGSSLFDPA
jgi:hypothetical protein